MTSSNSSAPPAEWRIRLALLLISLLISGAVAEIACRALGIGAPKVRRDTAGFSFFTHHPKLGWDLVPNTEDRLKTDEMDVAIRITDQGLRAHRTFPLEPQQGIQRIVVIGDSFSFGHGVEVEDAWPAKLEELLIERGRPSEVINLSVTGYGTDQQLLRFEERGAQLKPDLVILGLFVGNIFRNARETQIGYPKPRFVEQGGSLELAHVPVPTEAPQSGGLRLWTVINTGSRSVLEHLGYGEAWSVTPRIIERLEKRCREIGADLFVAVIPKDQVIYGSGQRQKLHLRTTRLANAMLDELGAPYLDLSGPLERAVETSPDRLYFPIDGHWTESGHRVAASAIAEALAQPDASPASP